MPTTDPDTARRALKCLSEVGVPFVVLCDQASLNRPGPLSDIDVAVSADARGLVRRLEPTIRAHDLLLVSEYNYDYGCLSLFVISPDANRGAHLDLMAESRLPNRLRLRPKQLVANREFGTEYDRPGRSSLSLYRKRKAAWKAGRGSSIVSREGLRVRVSYRVIELPRYLLRLLRPRGIWVHVTGSNAAALCPPTAERFSRVLVHVKLVAPTDKALGHWLKSVAATRWRSGLLFTHGNRPPRVIRSLCDVHLTVEDTDDVSSLSERLTRSMNRCLRRRLRNAQ